jgi:hypothetical protein
MTAAPEELYAQREQRFNDVVALKKPDRVPIMPLYVHNFPTLIKGISNRDAGYDHETRWQSTKEATLRFGWNFAPTNDVVASDFFAAYGNKQIMWAGEEGGLADDAPFQWVEDEYVKADELAEFVADPNGFTFNRILPRMGSARSRCRRCTGSPTATTCRCWATCSASRRSRRRCRRCSTSPRRRRRPTPPTASTCRR